MGITPQNQKYLLMKIRNLTYWVLRMTTRLIDSLPGGGITFISHFEMNLVDLLVLSYTYGDNTTAIRSTATYYGKVLS